MEGYWSEAIVNEQQRTHGTIDALFQQLAIALWQLARLLGWTAAVVRHFFVRGFFFACDKFAQASF